MSHILLVHGLKNSGKSTIAKYLTSKYGYVVIKMAGPLKKMIKSLLLEAGISDEMADRYIEGDLKETAIPELQNVTCRRLMETLGHDWRDMHSSDFWINIVIQNCRNALARGEKVIVDDIRYIEEIERLGLFKSHKIIVTRGDEYLLNNGENKSEVPIDVEYFDVHLKNDGSFDSLHIKLDNMIEVIDTYSSNMAAITSFE